MSPSAAAVVRPDTEPGIFAMLREDLDCVFARDPAARNRIEVLTTYPGLHAIVIHRVSHLLWQHGARFVARFLSFLTRMWTQIDIHPGAHIGRRFFIDHGCGVVIGERIDLDHHRMPDPVSKAISCLLERIGQLEAQLAGEIRIADERWQIAAAATGTDTQSLLHAIERGDKLH